MPHLAMVWYEANPKLAAEDIVSYVFFKTSPRRPDRPLDSTVAGHLGGGWVLAYQHRDLGVNYSPDGSAMA